MTVGTEMTCAGCGTTRTGDDGWEDELCGVCADDVRHGRPCGIDAFRGGLCDEVAS